MKVFKVLPSFSVLFMLMAGCSLHIGGYPLLPALFLIPVFYWLVFRPDLLPLWSLFGIGLFYDALMGYELGASSLLLMLSSLIGQYLRPFLSPYRFPFIWGAFSIYSFGYLFLNVLFVSGTFFFIISWGYGVILYPLVAWSLTHLHLRLHSYV